MSEASGRNLFIRMLGSAVGSQAVLSIASLAVGLLLIRRSDGQQYGAYVLVANAFLLLTSLQNAFFGPTLVLRMTPLQPAARGTLIDGIRREQRRLLCLVFGPLAALVAACAAGGLISGLTAALLLATTAAAPAALSREYFRSASLAQQRAQDVVLADLLYAVLLVSGAALATLLPLPAAGAVIAQALAAVAGAAVLARLLWRRCPRGGEPAGGLLRQIATLGAWSTAGAAIHWTFSQGYGYLVAATLNVSAVAAIAATRLLLMPVNLLSTGVGSMMLPLVARWLQQLGPQPVLRRTLLLALALAAAASCYLAAMWLLRDWIFAQVLKKQFAQRDLLLLLWSAISLLMVLRDQTIYLLVARGRLRRLTLMTLCSALLSLAVSYCGMLRFGVPGALIGVLCGEASNVLGILVSSVLDAYREPSGIDPAAVPQDQAGMAASG